MAKKDWEEIQHKLEAVSPKLLESYIDSGQAFFPSEAFKNPFLHTAENFSAKQFEKDKPGSWIPIYQSSKLSSFFLDNKLSPVRAGQAEFFFYRGDIFFDLQEINYTEIQQDQYLPIHSFIPSTLKVKFERNENAYLNKAVAVGIINHFIEGNNYSVLERTIQNKSSKRLLYGQFGKIKLTKPLHFQTTQGNKTINPGFQFEIDLVLENEKEIIIFEAKTGSKPQNSFSLLQLYYPLIYFRYLLGKEKKIRTVFVDIITNNSQEEYRLIEVVFNQNNFDTVQLQNTITYERQT